MPRLGHHPLERAILRRIAKLVQIHHLTHPVRLAARYGLTKEYVNRQFRNMNAPDMESMARRLAYWLDYFDDEPRESNGNILARRVGQSPKRNGQTHCPGT